MTIMYFRLPIVVGRLVRSLVYSSLCGIRSLHRQPHHMPNDTVLSESTMSNKIDFQTISFSSPQYESTLVLRETILRQPLGLTLSHEDIANDELQIHLGAFENDQLVGCVIVVPLTQPEAGYRIRQMAVMASHQGLGIGKQLVLCAENEVIKRQGKIIVLAARVTARAFYEKLKYTTVSDEFISNTIPHINMQKVL